MRRQGPVLTLLVVVLVGLTLLVLNMLRTPAGTATAAGQAATSAVAAAAPAGAPPAAPAGAPPAGAAAPAGAPPAGAAPPAAPLPAEARYVGHTEGGPSAITVAVRNGKATGYLCDGQKLEGWFQGSAVNGMIDAKGKGSNALTGSLAGGMLTGTVSVGGSTWSYTAAPVVKPAGLYRSKTPQGTVGWIKDSQGRVTGLANVGGVEEPAPPLQPDSVQQVEGDDQIVGK